MESEHVIDITNSNEASASWSTPVRPVNDITNTWFNRMLNSGYWISFEIVLKVSQIVAAIVVICLSSHEHPSVPLFTWATGYAFGCLLLLPVLFWRFYNPNASTSDQPPLQASRARVQVFVEYFKLGVDLYFAVWFVLGIVWVIRGHSSSSDAPNLYRLCIVFLAFSCIRYTLVIILFTTICCRFPRIISVSGFSEEDPIQNSGATTQSVNSLPTYKFKRRHNTNENERVEDAVCCCCICLAKYADDDEVMELPCSHVFHKECLFKWLKVNKLCPLCKIEVG